MLEVVEFLERIGRDALWSNASRAKLEHALAVSDLDPKLQAAILATDRGALDTLLGVVPLCVMLIPAEEPEKENEDEEPEEDPGTGGDVERSALSGMRLPA